MILESVVAAHQRSTKHRPWALSEVLKRLGRLRFARPRATPAGEDAYLLVLAAEQEIGAGREDQAQSLVNAAYAAFDQRFGFK